MVAVTGIRAYPAGFGFTLNLRLRNLDPRERRGFRSRSSAIAAAVRGMMGCG